MRSLSAAEVSQVQGGMRIVIAGGALLAWAHANRASLIAIKNAAVAENRRLYAEHAER